MNTLRIDGLTKSFDGIKVLDSISFAIEENTITGLIGLNGAGKTTLFNIISGFLKPDQGRIYYNNIDITGKSSYQIAQLGIGRLWQEARIFPKLTVLDNILVSRLKQIGENPFASILLPRKVKKCEKKNLENAIKWVEFVGLNEQTNRFAEDLSYGEQKLLALARLFATDCSLLLLDEPATGIHSRMLSKMHYLLMNVVKPGKTIIIVEHNIKFVGEIADKILLMNEGKIIASETFEELINNSIMKKVYIGV